MKVLDAKNNRKQASSGGLQEYVNMNRMLVDEWPLYWLDIIDKEITCTLASKYDSVKLVGMTSYLVVMTCYLVGMTCYLVVMTLLSCGNELVSCGNDFANLLE